MKSTRLIISHGLFEPDELAHILRWMAEFLDEDEATSYTGDDMFDALARLRDSAGRKLSGADHVRGSRPSARR